MPLWSDHSFNISCICSSLFTYMKVLSQITIALNQLTIGKNQIKVAMNNTEVGLEKLVSITEFIEYDIPMTIFLAMPCSFFYKIKKK